MMRTAIGHAIALGLLFVAGVPLCAQRGGRLPADDRSAIATALARARVQNLAGQAADLAKAGMSAAKQVLSPYSSVMGVTESAGHTLELTEPLAVLSVDTDRLRNANPGALDTLVEDTGLVEFLIVRDGHPTAAVQLRHFPGSDSLAMATSPAYLNEFEALRSADALTAPTGRRYMEIVAFHCRMFGVSDAGRAIVVKPASDCSALSAQAGQRLALAAALASIRVNLPPERRQ